MRKNDVCVADCATAWTVTSHVKTGPCQNGEVPAGALLQLGYNYRKTIVRFTMLLLCPNLQLLLVINSCELHAGPMHYAPCRQ